MNRKKHKIFIGPKEIAGYYTNLNKGLTELGWKVDFVEYEPHKMGYNQSKRVPFLVKIIRLSISAQNSSKSRVFRRIHTLIQDILKWMFMLQCLLKYDVFIFGYGQSLLRSNKDLKTLRRFGKQVIMNMAHGSELRVPSMDGFIISHDGQTRPPGRELARLSARRKNRMALIEQEVNFIVGAPYSSSAYATKPFINMFHLGLPYEGPATIDNQREDSGNKKMVVLHCPSHPFAKGTPLIREVIQKLEELGVELEYREVISRPNSEVLEELSKCDLVVDQTYSDLPLAGLATEAAWFGKPSLIAGYGLIELEKFVPFDRMPPSFRCEPGALFNKLSQLLKDPEGLAKVGQEAQSFVKTKWSALEIAKRYEQILANDVPKEWYLNPNEVFYTQGCGISNVDLKHQIKSQFDHGGLDSFVLSHRNDYLQFIQEVVQ